MTTNGPVSPGDLLVFYGLLKQGAAGMPAHIDLEAAGAFLGPAWFRGVMYDLGGHPGVVAGEQLCCGVRYRISDPAIVPALDAFEEIVPDDPGASLYQRAAIQLCDQTGALTGETAWIYWYNQAVTGYTRIEDGNWPLGAGRARPQEDKHAGP